MTSFYSVVQYVPDPSIDEKMNVGVVVFGDGRIRTRFVTDWRRVRNFGGEEIGYLQEFASRSQQWTPEHAEIPGLERGVRLDEEGFRKIAKRWINAIQFTEPRASLLAPEKLLDDVTRRFFRRREGRKRGFRDRRHAAGLAYSGLRSALERRLDAAKVERVLHKNEIVKGRLDQHRLDISIRNGELWLGAQGLSFEGRPTREFHRELDVTKWAIDDIKSKDVGAPFAVVTLPPKTGQSKTYRDAVRIFKELKAVVVPEREVSAWAEDAAQRVGKSLGTSQ